MGTIPSNTVLVVGLGRFGSAVVAALDRAGRDVLAVDSSPELVAAVADSATMAVEADATSADVLRSLGAQDCQTAVVAIGENLLASILVTGALVDLGIPEIWAKATSDQQGHILKRLGATRVVYPEREMGQRVGAALLGEVSLD